MTLQEATNFFESLQNETTQESEIKLYAKFKRLLTNLQNRAFSKDEMVSIEKELAALDLQSNPRNKYEYYKKALEKFEKYLNDTFSFVSKGYYTNRGIGLGLTFGILIGIIFFSRLERSLGIAVGLSIGMLIGLLIGRSLEVQAKAAGKML